MVKINKYLENESGAAFFEISNEDVKVCVTNVGCHLLALYTKDKNGEMGDIVMGYANEEECLTDTASAGSLVGRVCNRIAHAEFTLNGVNYQLAKNLGENHIHGGNVGFNRKLFGYEILEDGLLFHGVSPDQEEGYPGELTMDIAFRLNGKELSIVYDADTDADTILNLTTHTYFNLTGGKEKIYDHQLKMAAKRVAAIDATGVPTGEYPEVEGTPFDFLDFHTIGERIAADDEQIRRGSGYDHPFLIEEGSDQAVVYEPNSGRTVTISTTLPVLQVYTGNFLHECISSKWGRSLEDRDAVAIEAEYLPDSIHKEENPRVILRKGEHYHEETIYRFGIGPV